jgi:hypothetical protein
MRPRRFSQSGFACRMLWQISYLGEQRCPDGLDIDDLGSLDQGVELVGLGRNISLASVSPVIYAQNISRVSIEGLFFAWRGFGSQ